MSYLDDLKKKGQNLVQNVQNAGNAAYSGAKTLYDTARNVGNNVYNAATGKNTNQQQMHQQNNAMAGKQQAAMDQQETDWLAEYDSYKADEEAKKYSAGAQGAVGGQAANVTPAAQAALGEGAGQWKSELDGIMNKILNGEKFSYDMNGDAMYQQMADTYKNQANLAMQNSMAQAAAMTGGYGSSYGQMVGQQAFAGQMQGLNDIGMDLYNQALDQYIAEGDRLNDQYAMLAEREALDYNRGIDERNFEYQKGQDELAQKNYEGEFAYQQGRDTVADSQWDKSFEYQQGRDDVADKQWSESMQYQKDRDAVADSQWEQSFGYQQDRDQVADEQWQAELDRYLANDETAKEQWQAEYDRATANDKLAAEQWDKAFAADEEQRGIDNAYRDATLAEDQRQYDESMQFQKDRADVADSQWQAELDRYLANDATAKEQWEKSFAEDQRQYDKNMDYNYAGLEQADEHHDENLQWEKDLNEYMYGDGGFYDKQREDEQAYNTSEREASQDFTKNENALNRTHDVTMQNDAQLHQSDMYDKEFDNMYGENGFYTKQNAQDQDNWQAEFDREGEQWDALYGEGGLYNKTEPTEVTYNGGGTLQGQNVPTQLQNIPGLTTTDTSWFDENGNFKRAEFQGETADGKMSYRINGKTVTHDKGVNPYTETYNKDCKNGTFSNGYQPNNVNGSKLSKTGEQEYVNGVLQNVWKDEQGTRWIWDGTQNKYLDV